MILNGIGNTERKGGPWDARYASPVITLCGNTELDFSQAELGEGETEFVIAHGIGQVQVTVPHDLPVLVTGASFLGDREIFGESHNGIMHGADRASGEFATATGRRLRLVVFNLLGGVAVRRASDVARSV
ncbi:MAG TPA: LiaF domain-containing protein [Chloroflexota bacterium]|jgi:predicted membrane protein|nr:LiaF domain-containing protein [Chloroflexota bacterium]